MASNTLLTTGFWSVVAQWALIVVGLLLVARTIAFTVHPSAVWTFRPAQWWVFTMTGLALVLAASVSWTILSATGDGTDASNGAGSAMLITCVVSAVVIALFLLLPDSVMSVPLPSLLWTLPAFMVMAASAAFLVPHAGSHAWLFEPNPFRGYAAAGAVSVAGVTVLGLGIGTRLSMRITVRDPKGKEDAVNGAFVASRMVAMSHKPRGLGSPEGTDVLTLPKDAVAALPSEGQMAVSLVRFALSVFASAPWRADIVLIDGNTATATLKRNSVIADSTIVYRSELGLDGFRSPPGSGEDDFTARAHDVLTGAAAFLLMRLSESHPVLRSGLCGATRWRGLACQLLAGTPPWQSVPAAAEQLFAKAVDNDPGNDEAWLGYLHLRRGSTLGPPRTERRYVGRLREFYAHVSEKAQHDDGYLALAMRAARSLVYAQHNYSLLLTNEEDRAEQVRSARKVARELRDLTEKAEHNADRGLQKFAVMMKPSADILCSEGANGGEGDNSEQDGYRAPYNNYLRACFLAEVGRHAEALSCLEIALGSSELREWARAEISFKSLLATKKSRARLVDLIDQPRITDIEAFKPYERELARSGLRHPGDVFDTDDRATSPQLTERTLGWMRGICRLVEKCPSEENAIAWTNLITAEEVHDAAGLFALLNDAERLRRVNRRADPPRVPPLSPENIADWLTRLRPTPGRGSHIRQTSSRRRRRRGYVHAWMPAADRARTGVHVVIRRVVR
ncbi:hypothetical protein [Streptomyces humidus]|uniref:hypothetical protein n=1 Tax=Streptomyces humidus TaxID=52259 RepID=UPI00331A93F9